MEKYTPPERDIAPSRFFGWCSVRRQWGEYSLKLDRFIWHTPAEPILLRRCMLLPIEQTTAPVSNLRDLIGAEATIDWIVSTESAIQFIEAPGTFETNLTEACEQLSHIRMSEVLCVNHLETFYYRLL
jgi:hypothetical protein